MLNKVAWSEDRSYRSGTEHEPIEFYLDGLFNSIQFDLLLGYFSSSAINVLSLGFATFLYNGGKVRIVINNVLSEQDKKMVSEPAYGEDPTPFDLTDIATLSKILGEYDRHFFECVAWLIANDRIQIKAIQPKGKKGIAHYKSGVFSDGENSVGYKASCNFTAYGLLENLEELDAFLSWENSRSSKMIKNQNDYFNQIFAEENENIEYLDPKNIIAAIQDQFGNKDINELLIQEKKLLEKKAKKFRDKAIKRKFEKLMNTVDQLAKQPKFPFPEGPRDYQKEAYENWIENGKKGIFAMATGTGKTLTALNCLLNEYKATGTYKAVVIVPTIALVEQWQEECRKFNFQNIIKVSSKSNWDRELSFFNLASNFIDTSFIVIITYASFHRKKFQDYFKKLPEETLLIADEAHNLGAGKVSKTLDQIHLQKRIGLSATIHRKYDDEGNEKIENFFQDASPYCMSYTMKMALDKEWLCAYKYYPHVVELENDELEHYISISKELMKYFDASTGRYKKDPIVEKKLLERKRIIHKAKNKLPAFKQILKEEYNQKGNLKYTLVYVPEGKDPDFDAFDYIGEDQEDKRLIDDYTRAVSSIDFSVFVKQYTSASKHRNKLLNDFERGDLHVLTSMKCLDEGVDVPRSELAIFCASTGNPRQFIQRRGRVLRNHKDKTLAVVHDLVVVPKIEESSEFYNMERSLVKKELERVVDFAFLALNKMDTFSELEDVLEHYNLNLFEIEDNI